MAVINNWRSAHGFVLNTFQIGLRRRALGVDAAALVAQRLKRLESIQAKLREVPTRRLSQMQDVGGCRAVVKTVRHVRALETDYRLSELKHDPEDVDDYISTPRKSGYRGVHLIYRYYSDRVETFNGLRVEVQLRSELQHAWATAVETVGTFLKQSLKASRGHEEWLRFFALMGTAIATRERSPAVEDTPTGAPLRTELRKLAVQLDVAKKLHSYGRALETLRAGRLREAYYYLLALDPADDKVYVNAYPKNEVDRATEDYLALEKVMSKRPGAETVLVSVQSITQLRRAYPNYFLDTSRFVDAVRVATR